METTHISTDLPEQFTDLVPYRCPKCGHLRKFATLRELRHHLQHDHSFQMGCIKPHQQVRSSVFQGDTLKSCNIKMQTKSLNRDYGKSYISSNSTSSNSSGQFFDEVRGSREDSPLLESFKAETEVLERELQMAKQTELHNKAKAMDRLTGNKVDDVKPTLVGNDRGYEASTPYRYVPVSTSINLKSTLDAMNKEVMKSRLNHWMTSDALYKSQDVLQEIEQASEEKSREQQDLIQNLLEEIKVKDEQLQETTRVHGKLNQERSRLFGETESIVRETDSYNQKLQEELKRKGAVVENLSSELQALNTHYEKAMRSKETDLQSVKEKMNHVEWERDRMLEEMEKLLQQADTDGAELRNAIKDKEDQLEKVNAELSSLRWNQQKMLEKTMEVYKKADESQGMMKTVLSAKEDQLKAALDKIERMKDMQVQLIEGSRTLTDQADENTNSLKKLLQMKENQVREAMSQLEFLKQEKRQLEDSSASIAQEAQSSIVAVENLKTIVKNREKDLQGAKRELHNMKTFLHSVAERERKARVKLEHFIENLINRAEKAETELHTLRSQSSDEPSKKKSTKLANTTSSNLVEATPNVDLSVFESSERHSLPKRIPPPKPPRIKSRNEKSKGQEKSIADEITDWRKHLEIDQIGSVKDPTQNSQVSILPHTSHQKKSTYTFKKYQERESETHIQINEPEYVNTPIRETKIQEDPTVGQKSSETFSNYVYKNQNTLASQVYENFNDELIRNKSTVVQGHKNKKSNPYDPKTLSSIEYHTLEEVQNPRKRNNKLNIIERPLHRTANENPVYQDSTERHLETIKPHHRDRTDQEDSYDDTDKVLQELNNIQPRTYINSAGSSHSSGLGKRWRKEISYNKYPKISNRETHRSVLGQYPDSSPDQYKQHGLDEQTTSYQHHDHQYFKDNKEKHPHNFQNDKHKREGKTVLQNKAQRYENQLRSPVGYEDDFSVLPREYTGHARNSSGTRRKSNKDNGVMYTESKSRGRQNYTEDQVRHYIESEGFELLDSDDENEDEFIYIPKLRPGTIGKAKESPKDSPSAEKEKSSRKLPLMNPVFDSGYPDTHKSMVNLQTQSKPVIRGQERERSKRSKSLSPAARSASREPSFTKTRSNHRIIEEERKPLKKDRAREKVIVIPAPDSFSDGYVELQDEESMDNNFDQIMDENGILWEDDTLPDVSDSEFDRVSPSGSEAIATKKACTAVAPIITKVESVIKRSYMKNECSNSPVKETKSSENDDTKRLISDHSSSERNSSNGGNKRPIDTVRYRKSVEGTRRKNRPVGGVSDNGKKITSTKPNADDDFQLSDHMPKTFRPIRSEPKYSSSDREMTSGAQEIHMHLRHSPVVNIHGSPGSASLSNDPNDTTSEQSGLVSTDNNRKQKKESLDNTLKRITEKYKAKRVKHSPDTSSQSSSIDDKIKSISNKYAQQRQDIVEGKGVSPQRKPYTYRNIDNSHPTYHTGRKQFSSSTAAYDNLQYAPFQAGQQNYHTGQQNYHTGQQFAHMPVPPNHLPPWMQMPPGYNPRFQTGNHPGSQPPTDFPYMFPYFYGYTPPLHSQQDPQTNPQTSDNNMINIPAVAANANSGHSKTEPQHKQDVIGTTHESSDLPYSASLNKQKDQYVTVPLGHTNKSKEEKLNVGNGVNSQTDIAKSSHLSLPMNESDIESENVPIVKSSVEELQTCTQISETKSTMEPLMGEHESELEAVHAENLETKSAVVEPRKSRSYSSDIDYDSEGSGHGETFHDEDNIVSSGISRRHSMDRRSSDEFVIVNDVPSILAPTNDNMPNHDDNSHKPSISRSVEDFDPQNSDLVDSPSDLIPEDTVLNPETEPISVSEGFSMFAEPILDLEDSSHEQTSKTQSMTDLGENFSEYGEHDGDTDTESVRRDFFEKSQNIKDLIESSNSDYSAVYQMKSSRNTMSSASSQASFDIPEIVPLSRREAVKHRRQALRHIFYFLDTATLCRVALVCREWRQVTKSPKLWRRVELRNEKISTKFLLHVARRCSQLKVLILEDLRPRNRKKTETIEEYQQSIQSSLEVGYEQILKRSESTLHTISIVNCGTLLSAKCLWAASCYSRMLKHVTYLSDFDPINAEVMWALGSGCRDLRTLQVYPLNPCQRPGNFSTRCLQLIGKCFPDLQKLSVGNVDVDIKALVYIAKQCRKLKFLELDHMSLVPAEIIENMCDNGLKYLTSIRFIGTPVAPDGLKILRGNCHYLDCIYVQMTVNDYFKGTKQKEDLKLFKQEMDKLEELKKDPSLLSILRLKLGQVPAVNDTEKEPEQEEQSTVAGFFKKILPINAFLNRST